MQNSIKIDLGSGYRHPEGFITLDNREITSPDIVCDLSEGIPFKTNTVNFVRCYDFMEHLPRNKFINFLEEVYRVLEPNGIFEHFTPSDEGRGYAMDPTHTNPINLNTFWYIMKDEYRALYSIRAKFDGFNKNQITDAPNKIIHVFGRMRALK